MIFAVTLRIFLLAPSALLTDHRPHGDGLVACGFVRELSARGHHLDVAAQRVDIVGSLPSNVGMHQVRGKDRPAPLDRLALVEEVRRVYRCLNGDTNFDVVHQLNPVDAGVSLALADSRSPLILGPYVPDWPSPRGGAMHGAVNRIKRATRAAQQRRAAMLLLSTPAAASKVEVKAPVRHLTPGIEPGVWAPGQGGRGQDVLLLSNLEARKGVRTAIAAFERICAELPAARLLIAGTGSEAAAIRRIASSTACADRIELLGPVGRKEAVAVMQACDLYCLPSFGEPFGMTALEAMACARPVVATDAGGVRFLVSQRGGRKVPPGDPRALAGALRELLLDADLRRSMGEHNRRLVEERYAWSPVVDRLEDIYREAIRMPRAALRGGFTRLNW
jgi:glycosyltransferase involved in cell wall biosynthesis